jgi:hypothetical protein
MSTDTPNMTKEKTILVVDWSALTMNRLHSLLSSEMPITRPDEISEIRYRVARKLFPVIEVLDPFMVVYAIDNKVDGIRNYWRLEYLRKYYEANHEIYYSKSEDAYYFHFDNGYRTLGEEGFTKKLAKKNVPKDLEIAYEYSMDDSIPFPEYKGSRKNLPWHFEMTKDKYYTAMDTLVKELCGLRNSRLVDVEGAEADDIAGVLTCSSDSVNHVLYTHDGDWTQLQSETTHILNLSNGNYLEPIDTHKFIEEKIIMGDSGDGISSTWIKGKATDVRGSDCNLGEKGAKTIWDNQETHLINPEVYKRNRDLIQLNLETIPEDTQKGTLEAIKSPQDFPETTWDHFTLGPLDREQVLAETTGSILTRKKMSPIGLDLIEGEC